MFQDSTGDRGEEVSINEDYDADPDTVISIADEDGDVDGDAGTSTASGSASTRGLDAAASPSGGAAPPTHEDASRSAGTGGLDAAASISGDAAPPAHGTGGLDAAASIAGGAAPPAHGTGGLDAAASTSDDAAPLTHEDGFGSSGTGGLDAAASTSGDADPPTHGTGGLDAAAATSGGAAPPTLEDGGSGHQSQEGGSGGARAGGRDAIPPIASVSDGSEAGTSLVDSHSAGGNMVGSASKQGASGTQPSGSQDVMVKVLVLSNNEEQIERKNNPEIKDLSDYLCAVKKTYIKEITSTLGKEMVGLNGPVHIKKVLDTVHKILRLKIPCLGCPGVRLFEAGRFVIHLTDHLSHAEVYRAPDGTVSSPYGWCLICNVAINSDNGTGRRAAWLSHIGTFHRDPEWGGKKGAACCVCPSLLRQRNNLERHKKQPVHLQRVARGGKDKPESYLLYTHVEGYDHLDKDLVKSVLHAVKKKLEASQVRVTDE